MWIKQRIIALIGNCCQEVVGESLQRNDRTSKHLPCSCNVFSSTWKWGWSRSCIESAETQTWVPRRREVQSLQTKDVYVLKKKEFLDKMLNKIVSAFPLWATRRLVEEDLSWKLRSPSPWHQKPLLSLWRNSGGRAKSGLLKTTK